MSINDSLDLSPSFPLHPYIDIKNIGGFNKEPFKTLVTLWCVMLMNCNIGLNQMYYVNRLTKILERYQLICSNIAKDTSIHRSVIGL